MAPTPAEIQARLDFVDAALAVAGHQVTDPAIRDLWRRVAAEELTADEAVALVHRNR